MNKRLHLIIILLISIFGIQSISAQVRGINYTLSPNAEYVFWNKKSGLKNGLMIGGKFGFGFGELLELRGLYSQSINLETKFSNFEIPNYADSLYNSNQVKMTRWGGEFKINVSKGKFLPYIIAGTGVQSIQLDTFAVNRQIYVSAGAGIQFTIKDRFSLGLEAKNTAYRFNSGRNLLTADDKSAFGVTDADFDFESLNNWSIGASLQIYLGGSNPKKMSALDKAYYDNISNSYRNISWVVEPAIGKMIFSDDLGYRDAFVAGGGLGLDFGKFVGARAFYWQAMQEGELTKFDKLAIYGGELKMNLNTNTGIVPYITLGGGNIDIQDDYQGRSIVASDSSVTTLRTTDKGFATGGLGLTIPLSKAFKIFGSAKAMLTSGSSVNDFQAPEQIQTSWLFNAGVTFSFGKKAQNTDDLLYSKIDQELAIQEEEYLLRINDLQAKYKTKVIDLENQLSQALAKEDYEAAAEIKKEKEEAEEAVAELDKKEEQAAVVAETVVKSETTTFTTTPAQPTTPIVEAPVAPVTQATAPAPNGQIQVASTNSQIQMSPAEFENLIEEIMENMGGGYGTTEFYPYVQEQMYAPSMANPTQSVGSQEINRRVAELEKQIQLISEQQSAIEASLSTQLTTEMESFSAQLDAAMLELNTNINKNQNEMQKVDERLNMLETAPVENPGKKKKKKIKIF